MATQNRTKGGTTSLPYTPSSEVVVLRNTLDFAAVPAAASDVIEAINIPAGTLVLRAGYKVITPDGNAATGTLGDGADPDGYVVSGNLNAAAGTRAISGLALAEGTPNTIVGYSNGKLYTAADTIDWIATDALAAAKVEFFAVCIAL